MTVEISNIVYESDGEDVKHSLPSELTIDVPENEDNIQLYIENYISNTLGFLTESFVIN